MQSVNKVTVSKHRIVTHESENEVSAMNRRPLHRARSDALNTTIHFAFRLHVRLQVIISRTSTATVILRTSLHSQSGQLLSQRFWNVTHSSESKFLPIRVFHTSSISS